MANAVVPQGFRFLLYALVGALVGLEIPLVMRILKRNVALRDLVSQLQTFDYLGALAVSVAFLLLLLPHLGLIRTGLLFSLMNAAGALWALWLFRHELAPLWRARAGLWAKLAAAGHLTTWAEDKFYQDPIVFSATSRYQRIVVTQGRAGHWFFLNGNLQFAERDEYRHHEALVHPAMSAFASTGGSPRNVAVLGGGDGMAVREILKHSGAAQITLVELDPNMTQLFATHPTLSRLNGGALARFGGRGGTVLRMKRRTFLGAGCVSTTGCDWQTGDAAIDGSFTASTMPAAMRCATPRPNRGPGLSPPSPAVPAPSSPGAVLLACLLRGIDDFALFELEDTLGGMACPLGAHYLPVPGDDASEVQDFLEELGLRRRVSGRWQYDERHRCHSPQERLFFHGHWPEGLLPVAGVGGGYVAAVPAVRRVG